ncbi:DUF5133 domain-containing protein [Streptomyces sp. tea 10]|nr:DUF5133 domain-containing protein [Streptomyces sp. tea 10]
MMLTPHVRTVAAALRSYRDAQAALLSGPSSPLRRRQLDDAAYTLCVLTVQHDVADAAMRAERLMAASSAFQHG